MSLMKKCINYGKQKNKGGHNHTTNKGNDRTPAQQAGDIKRRKEQKKTKSKSYHS